MLFLLGLPSLLLLYVVFFFFISVLFTASLSSSPVQAILQTPPRLPHDTSSFGSIPRISNISASAFAADYLRTGHPVIVTDATAGWIARSWTLEALRKRFPLEFDEEVDADALLAVPGGSRMDRELRNEYSIPYFLVNNTTATSTTAATATATATATGSRSRSSGGRKEAAGDIRTHGDADDTLLQHHRPPPSSHSPGHAVVLSHAFIFSARETKPHLDQTCLQTISVQLQGRKMWTLWPVEPNEADEDDMAAAKTNVNMPPPLRGEVGPGDILYFPPGMWHGTKNSAPEPSLAASFYIDFVPLQQQRKQMQQTQTYEALEVTEEERWARGRTMPVTYYRRRQSALLSSSFYCGCGAHWTLMHDKAHSDQKERCRALRDRTERDAVFVCDGDAEYNACARCTPLCGMEKTRCRDDCSSRCQCPLARPFFDGASRRCVAICPVASSKDTIRTEL